MPSCGQTVLPDDLDTRAARRRFMEDGQRAMFRQDAMDLQQHMFDQAVHRVGTTLPHAPMTREVAAMFNPGNSALQDTASRGGAEILETHAPQLRDIRAPATYHLEPVVFAGAPPFSDWQLGCDTFHTDVGGDWENWFDEVVPRRCSRQFPLMIPKPCDFPTPQPFLTVEIDGGTPLNAHEPLRAAYSFVQDSVEYLEWLLCVFIPTLQRWCRLHPNLSNNLHPMFCIGPQWQFGFGYDDLWPLLSQKAHDIILGVESLLILKYDPEIDHAGVGGWHANMPGWPGHSGVILFGEAVHREIDTINFDSRQSHRMCAAMNIAQTIVHEVLHGIGLDHLGHVEDHAIHKTCRSYACSDDIQAADGRCPNDAPVWDVEGALQCFQYCQPEQVCECCAEQLLCPSPTQSIDWVKI